MKFLFILIVNETLTSLAAQTQTKEVNKQRTKSLHDLLSFHLNNQSNSLFRTDACIQTLGLEEPDNQSLRHINGKLQINKSIYSKITNSETFIMENNLPILDYSAANLEQEDLKVNFRPSNFLTKTFSPIQTYKLSQNQYETNPNRTPMVQTRSRSKSNYSTTTTSISVVPPIIVCEDSVQQPPPLKPRVKESILDLNVPITKPRMRPTRISDKYQTNQTDKLDNPLPKPRNSIHLNETINKYEVEIEIEPKKSELSFKANLLKNNKKQDYLQVSPSSSSSTSPCSSTSALLMSSSPRSEFQSQAIDSTSSLSSSSTSSKTSNSFVSQMKNIFESQQIDLNKKKTLNEDFKKASLVQQGIYFKFIYRKKKLCHLSLFFK